MLVVYVSILTPVGGSADNVKGEGLGGPGAATCKNRRLVARRWIYSALAVGSSISVRRKILYALAIFSISFLVKSLQAVDLAPVMYTQDQPAAGMALEYNNQARSILDGNGILISKIKDPSDTTLLEHPPGYPIFLAAVYRLSSGDYFAVQLVQNILDSLTPVILFLLAGTILSWRVGLASGIFAGIWHHLSYHSNLILPDSLCALPLLAGVYFLVLAERKGAAGFWSYELAGSMMGLSVWLRPNAMFLGVFLALALIVVSKRSVATMRRRVAFALASILIFAPITVRNYLIYHKFVPVQVGMGLNLWTGIGQAGGKRFGAVGYDRLVAAQEAISYDQPSYGTHWYTPDGITRDHDRAKRSLAVIREHPLWYAVSVFRRLGHMFNYSAEASLIFKASDRRLVEAGEKDRDAMESKAERGIALDPQERIEASPGPLLLFARESEWLRPIARAAQRIEKETVLVFMFLGVIAAILLSARRAFLLLMTPAYYMIFQSLVHTEFRYTLPMHYFLFVFAATGWVVSFVLIGRGLKYLFKKRMGRETYKLAS